MEELLLDILGRLRALPQGQDALGHEALEAVVRRHNRGIRDNAKHLSKRRILPFYLHVRQNDPDRWASWSIDEELERRLLKTLRMKPRRTASGVATITVITRPQPCSSDCVYCPCDLRMPKSYLSNEPACQRAERSFFDPYLQVTARLRALDQMGHAIDKIELIVLGGTWSDYPRAYQLWFVSELFRAVNDFGESRVAGEHPEERDRRYRACGLTYNKDELLRRTGDVQRQVDEGLLSYNEAIRQIGGSDAWRAVEAWQQATTDDLLREHARNEEAAHRVVGLTIETRPDLISPETAREMRELGCTKVQMGIQSLDQHILEANQRRVSVAQIADAFCALRLAGFKIQVHFMANLLGATPEADKADYLRLVSDERFLPDEVKLYPCCLVQSSRLGACYADGSWQPYSEDELMDLLVADTLATPAYTRISRMIRDISSTDIVAGNKRTNLRQMVEARIARLGAPVHEIRMREVATTDVDPAALRLDCVAYRTTVSDERFLQWVTDDGHIAAFLRLSLPREGTQAMIREVHVYGRVASLGSSERGGAQHAGLGRQLVEEACAQAREAGFSAINVISSVGTRGYYRNLGFGTAGLYQQRSLTADAQAGTGQTQT